MIETQPDKVVIPRGIESLAAIAVDSALEVHRQLGPGLLESAYEACFTHELSIRGICFKRQLAVPLHYKDDKDDKDELVDVGFRADVVIAEKLLVELKAVDEVLPVHRAQVITYLKLLNLPLGLLINFNSVLLKHGLRRVLNIPRT